ncbi:hypothetical protein [Curtobacterium sp. Arg-1]|uniref:hypothetical protein n=1 Tax=Curtobacterium sp. Arg-1 TaxID=2935040 RepID=UPI0021D7D990|nr:hypothetical protein [Curtobacterium sp. Arg-1]UXZ57102.1 hypothetical protein MXD64_13990 [Curtobacterium sp. Arg-1]
MQKLQQYAKAIVALVGSILTAGAFTLPDEVQPWVGLGMAVLTAIATYGVKNGAHTTVGKDEPPASADEPGSGDALVPGDGIGDDGQPKHAANS